MNPEELFVGAALGGSRSNMDRAGKFFTSSRRKGWKFKSRPPEPAHLHLESSHRLKRRNSSSL
jgi:hypothetical protein